jgi:hypothetical protein
MDKSYRVPSIKEFVPGFEYEWRSPGVGEWVKDHVQKGEDVESEMVKYFSSCIRRKVVRVKV